MRQEYKIFKDIFSYLKAFGKETSPRGMKVLEIEDFSILFSPYERFMSFKDRKLSLPYIKKEFRWYLRGDKKDLSILNHAKIWETCVENESINSNYGQYIFGEINQYDNVVNILKDDIDSRRASIVILNSEHLLHSTKDIPCTYSINFRIRNYKLNMSVFMRSQDAIYGMGNDIPTFSFIHEMMLNSLRKYYPLLEYGNYGHSVNSFHVYERHFEMLDKLVCSKLDDFVEIDVPKISSSDEVDFMRLYSKDSSLTIPENYLFTKWLFD